MREGWAKAPASSASGSESEEVAKGTQERTCVSSAVKALHCKGGRQSVAAGTEELRKSGVTPDHCSPSPSSVRNTEILHVRHGVFLLQSQSLAI